MDTEAAFTSRDLLNHVIGDVVNSVSDRGSDPPHLRATRAQAATWSVMAFEPRDGVEAMLAGHCVMFHELIVDSVGRTLGGEDDARRRWSCGSIIAMDRAFGGNLTRLERRRSRADKVSAGGGATPDRAETDIADRVLRHQAASSGRQTVPVAADEAAPVAPARPSASAGQPDKPSHGDTVPARNGVASGQSAASVPRDAVAADHSAAWIQPAAVPALLAASLVPPSVVTQERRSSVSPPAVTGAVSPPVNQRSAVPPQPPSRAAIAACEANPEAMAALAAGDPMRFAHAMGVDRPSEAYLAAASAQMSGLDRQAAGFSAAAERSSYVGNRQARRHPGPK